MGVLHENRARIKAPKMQNGEVSFYINLYDRS
jgi:hypothetical protein